MSHMGMEFELPLVFWPAVATAWHQSQDIFTENTYIECPKVLLLTPDMQVRSAGGDFWGICFVEE